MKYTLKAVQAELRAVGISLTKEYGEYRVNFRGSRNDDTASYDSDLESIRGTGFAMARERDEPKGTIHFVANTGYSQGTYCQLDVTPTMRVTDKPAELMSAELACVSCRQIVSSQVVG